jgi:DNA-directed RNA polymerase subunit RPC12/RpoP
VGKRTKHDKELGLLDKLKHENKVLKKHVASLRKQLQRIDIDRYENIKEIIHKHDSGEHSDDLKPHEESLKKIWECFECSGGVLQLTVLNRRDGEFYYRKCNNCNHRTKLKPFTKDVKNGPNSV